MMTQISRRLGLILAAAGLTVSGLLAIAPASALPAGTPKIGMVCTPGSVNGSTHHFDLVTGIGYIQTPDGNSVFMWSYADANDPDPALKIFQYPGPNLCVTQGETVEIQLHNTLPEPSSIVFPGQDAEVTASGGAAGLLTKEAAPNGDVTYSFTAGNPGTYLYESGSDVDKQIEMGLYGALIVRPSIGADYAYDTSTQFDSSREYLLLLADIDPDLHHAVETHQPYDHTTKHDRYYTINGRSFPDTVQDNGSALLPNQPYGALVRIRPMGSTDQPALIRMINAGTDNHPFHPHGNHTRQIAQDGRLLLATGGGSASTEHFGETIGAGQAEDFLLRWDNRATDTAGVPFNDDWNPVDNQLPVGQPNYRNLTFKDGRTWYSANPYLGYKGTLPTGATSLNLCGEWYFPFHSHALNEFSNFNEGFGGMGTLLRVDPQGGCFGFPAGTTLVGGALKSGSVTNLGVADSSYYQVNPKTTTLAGGINSGATSITVNSNAGFPAAPYYIRIGSEVIQVTAKSGVGNVTWTVVRHALGTSAASHSSGSTVTALATDWYATFSGVVAGSQNLKVTYQGKNCASTSGTTCAVLTTNVPQQTVKICDWTISGAAGCSSATSNGWVTLAAPGPSQPQAVGSAEVTSTWTLPGPASNYIGTGTYKGKVRVLVHTQRWTASSPTPFSTWANLMKIVYDAP